MNNQDFLKSMKLAKAEMDQWARKWELGDVVLCKSPLAGKLDSEGEPFLECFEFILAHQHPNNPDLFVGMIADDNDSDYLRCSLDIDVPEENYAGICRVYPHLMLWIHSDDMKFEQRIGRVQMSTVFKMKNYLKRILGDSNFLKDFDQYGYDDPFYEEFILEKYISILEVYQQQLFDGVAGR